MYIVVNDVVNTVDTVLAINSVWAFERLMLVVEIV